MIINVEGSDKGKLLNLLKENDILYKDITYQIFDEIIEIDVKDMIDNEEDEILFTLSEKELKDLKEYIVDSFMDYDFSYHDEFIRECIDEWMKERKAKIK